MPIISIILLCVINPLSAQEVSLKITLVNSSISYNNLVGNEWSTISSVNGKNLFEGNSVEITIEKDEKITLNASATERDKYSDRGTNSKSISVSELNSDEPNYIDFSVTVREDRGRYAGNTAGWKFRFKIELL